MTFRMKGVTMDELSKKLKELIVQGNVMRIMVKKDDCILINIPVCAGVVGMLIFTYESLAVIIASLVAGCNVYIVNKDEEIIDVKELLNTVKDNIMT